MGYSQTLGEFIVKSHSLDLPEDLVSWIKLLTLDTIGCGLLAASLQWVDRLLATLRATEGQGPATVWGHSTHLSAANAAMVNGTAVHGFELDDVGADGHFGAVTTTSALALAETGIPLSGLDLIRATVAGIEVQTRVSNCVGRVAHVTCGVHGPGLFGTFGAASTSCYVLALDAERSSHALANAAQFTSYGVNFKMWACRAPIHPALEAVKSLQSARRVDYRSIERVEVALPESDFKAVGHSYLPSTPTAAQLNLQYCLAVMLMDGEVFLNQFSEERIAESASRDWIPLRKTDLLRFG